MICKFILLGLAGLTLAGEPDVFQNYFDDTIKEVDIPLDAAIKACLQNGNTFADKVKKAYADCFGSADYDFGDLAAKEGSEDSDNDGLPDSFEGNEKCFYKKMGWVDAAGALSADAIKGDLAGLDAGTKTEFDGNIDKCASWNGDFGSRRKREAEESETDEEISNVPSVMESGSSALGWLKSVVRKTRNAEPGKRKKRGNKKKAAKQKRKGGKKGGARRRGRKSGRNGNKPNKKGKKNRKNKRGRKGEKKRKAAKNKRKGGKKGGTRRGSGRNGKNPKKNGKKKNKNKNKQGRKSRRNSKKTKRNGRNNGKRNNKNGKKNGKKKNKSRNKNGKRNNNNGKKNSKRNNNKGKKPNGRGNRNSNAMEESTYNKLWCFDLSLEQILEKCVENKIKN